MRKSSGGRPLVNPSLERINYWLFKNPKRWSAKPDAGIVFVFPDSSTSNLLIAYGEEKGYYVSLDQNHQKKWILFNGMTEIKDLNKKHVKIDQDYYVSEGLLCDGEMMWEAVKYFVETGQKCPALTWVSDFDLPEGAKWA
jgi:hypothetical protein